MQQLIREGELLLTKAFIPFKNQQKHEPVKLVLDTGASLTIVDTQIMDFLGYSARVDGIKKSSLDGAAGRSEGYLLKVPQFECLGFTFTDFTVACHDMNSKTGVAGLLGMNFLKHFCIELDFRTGHILNMKLP